MSMKITEGQLDFLGLLNEYKDEQGATVRIREPKAKRLKPVKTEEPEQLCINFDEPSFVKVGTIEEQQHVNQPNTDGRPEHVKQSETAENQMTAKQTKSDEKQGSAVQAVDVEKLKHAEEPESAEKLKHAEEDKLLSKEILFKQCKKCWCFDCKHNSRNDGVPREMCGTMIPCPACDGCIAEDSATICEIANAKEGCRLRAIEEGIVSESEFMEY